MGELEALSKLKKAGRLRFWSGTIEIDEHELHAICDEIQAEHDKAVVAMNGTAGNSRHAALFGTPEQTAQTLARMCRGVDTCGTCPLFGAALNHCKNDYTDLASITEWLRGDA